MTETCPYCRGERANPRLCRNGWHTCIHGTPIDEPCWECEADFSGIGEAPILASEVTQ
jgi:hypothetical protein